MGVTRPRRAWAPAALRTELEEFLRGFPVGVWPRAADFVAAGREDLRTAVKRHGGAAYWAQQLRRELAPGQDRTPYGQAEARGDAVQVLERLGSVPGSKRLRELGYHRLATYFMRAGGRTVVLGELGLPLANPPRPGSVRDPGVVAERRARREAEHVEQARSIVAELGCLPGTTALREMGYSALANYIQNVAGGAKRFIARYGLYA